MNLTNVADLMAEHPGCWMKMVIGMGAFLLLIMVLGGFGGSDAPVASSASACPAGYGCAGQGEGAVSGATQARDPAEDRREVAWNDCIFEAADRAYLDDGINIGRAGVGPLPDYNQSTASRVKDLGGNQYQVRGWLTLVYGSLYIPDKRVSFTCKIRVLVDPTWGWETHVVGFWWG